VAQCDSNGKKITLGVPAVGKNAKSETTISVSMTKVKLSPFSNSSLVFFDSKIKATIKVTFTSPGSGLDVAAIVTVSTIEPPSAFSVRSDETKQPAGSFLTAAGWLNLRDLACRCRDKR
jgi:hypothetical protein